ncbi:MAG: hypothetical protein WC428_02205 [Candidatus Paceibacterota bacterium]
MANYFAEIVNKALDEKWAKEAKTLKNADFKMYYDKGQMRNIWVLGYFGGGAVNITNALALANEYAKKTGVPVETVCIDEVLSSRRFKGFKYMYSTQFQKKVKSAVEMENVHQWLRD